MTAALTLAALALIGIYLLSRSILLGWASLLLASLYNYAFGLEQSTLAGLHLSPLDLLEICLLMAGILRTLTHWREANTSRLLGAAYTAVLALSIARGLAAFGFAAVANECRGFVGLLIGVLYFMTAPVDPKSLHKYVRLYICYGAGLALVAVLAYAGLDVGAEAWAHHAEIADGIDGRLLPAGAAAALVVCFLFSTALSLRRGASLAARCLPVLYLALALYLRHRTIWAMLLACFLGGAFADAHLFRRLLPLIATSAIAASAVIAFAPNLAAGGVADYESAAGNSGTLAWRVESWRELVLSKDQTVSTVLLGNAMGSGYWRLYPQAGLYENYSPHNEFLANYLRVGLIGLPFLLGYAGRPMLKLWRRRVFSPLETQPSPRIWALVVVVIVVYGLAYSIEPDLYALVGFAAAITVRLAKAQTVSKPSHGYKEALSTDFLTA